MGRGRNQRRGKMAAIDEINMTPLLDLTFLLLIIFMITAPLLEFGIDVSPPEMNADEIEPDEQSKIVNLDAAGQIVFNHRTISSEQLLSELSALHAANPKQSLLIRADGKRPYQEVIALMKTVKDSGFKNISLITQAEDD